MAATDNPLKRLVTTFIEDFAEWVLGTQVAGVTSRNIELYADTIRSDQIFLVKLIDKRTVILHLEFQGRRTDKPMSLRELDYLSRLTQTYRDMELYSVVFYVGQGAGRHDTGSHQVKSPTGDITLSWKYKVIRLWEMDAEEIWALDRTTFLPLIGQTQIENPDEMLPKVVEKIKGIQDNEQQKRLLTELKALMDDEEVYA
ncbi:hypothetical protein PN36_12325 [Candidatus Thiomargarita nelsonii]|uniref:Uncharacterized protein n=1 Tax=Candidatus Thiomargarita nelsonii TaxID=1003181 RepID=A0A4E0QQV8_9GAMM|nr:hypothetical protein PN36_12325 [Candidatus Thiomargarita nelsonii]